MKKRSSGNFIEFLLFGIFAVVGVGLLVGAIVAAVVGQRFMEKAVLVDGTIVRIETSRDSDGDTHHSVYVSYDFEGASYNDVRLSSYSSTMYEGKAIALYVDPENPRHIASSLDTWLVSLILGIMGLVFALVGVIPLCILTTKKRQNKRIMETGRRLYATVEEIRLNTSYRVNGRSPYQIICSYYDSYADVTYRFKSDNLWVDPQAVFPEGSTIPVMVMEGDYSKYYVDAKTQLEQKIVDYT